MLWLFLCLVSHTVSLVRILHNHKIQRFFDLNNGFVGNDANFGMNVDDYDEENIDYDTSYCAAVGFESMITSVGNRRYILPSEYYAIFRLFPGILNLHNQSTSNSTVSNIWPVRCRDSNCKDGNLLSDEDEDNSIFKESRAANDYLKNLYSFDQKENDVTLALKKFRKTILGVEKYRINNPGAVARQYCHMLRTCLENNSSYDVHSEWWGAAANALQYAGLSFRDHVNISTDGMTTLHLNSLWTQTLSRLLDLDTSLPPSTPQTIGVKGTWDQRYFSQVSISPVNRRAVQDMQLGVMRVALCAIFSSISERDSESYNDSIRVVFRRSTPYNPEPGMIFIHSNSNP